MFLQFHELKDGNLCLKGPNVSCNFVSFGNSFHSFAPENLKHIFKYSVLGFGNRIFEPYLKEVELRWN